MKDATVSETLQATCALKAVNRKPGFVQTFLAEAL